MPQIITEVRNAQSLNTTNTSFDLEINHPQYSWIPYTITPHDLDATIDNSILLKLIGSRYAKYVAPTQSELDAALSIRLRAQRDGKLINDVDPIVTNPLRWDAMSKRKQDAIKAYRVALLDMPKQAGFPNNIKWPKKP